MTGGPNFGHCASLCVGYDQRQEVCSTATLYLSTSVVDLNSLAVRSVPVVSYRAVVVTRVGTLEATLETSKERVITLESQVASKDADIAAKSA